MSGERWIRFMFLCLWLVFRNHRGMIRTCSGRRPDPGEGETMDELDILWANPIIQGDLLMFPHTRHPMIAHLNVGVCIREGE